MRRANGVHCAVGRRRHRQGLAPGRQRDCRGGQADQRASRRADVCWAHESQAKVRSTIQRLGGS